METNVSTNDKRANSIIKNSVPHAQVIQQNSQTSSDPYIAFKTHRHTISHLLHHPDPLQKLGRKIFSNQSFL
jgi:hypothetical protein